MKKRFVGFIAGVLLGITLTSGVVFAKQIRETAELLYDNIKIVINGVEIQPKDANGNYVEPFTIHGTTYLPVRGISSALGLNVEWDEKTNTVSLSNALKPPFTLSAGQYIVGEDIQSGKYNCRAVSGSGNFIGTVESLGFMGLNTILASEDAAEDIEFYENRSTYDNLRLKDGDVFTIGGDLKIEFIGK